MSLINREDLLQTLGITDMDCEKCGWYSRTARRCKRGSDFEDACCAIDDAPEVKSEPHWIPVSERLPEENGLYLVTVNAQIRPVRIYEYAPWEMDEERKYWINDCDDHSHVFNHFVKAWMSLPERYREGGN